MENENMELLSEQLELLSAAFPDEVSLHDDGFTLTLSEGAYCKIQLIPTAQIVSYRCQPEEKARMEATVTAMRESLDNGAWACCSTALQVWSEGESTVEHQPEPTVTEGTAQSSTHHYHWITGEPLTDRKSTFQAHICLIESQADVRPALDQLIMSTSKLQRATHNMVRS
jgi:hypothetical protein